MAVYLDYLMGTVGAYNKAVKQKLLDMIVRRGIATLEDSATLLGEDVCLDTIPQDLRLIECLSKSARATKIAELFEYVKSEARLEEEINYNWAYKWFCGLGLTEKAPDAGTISQNRIRRFRDNNIAEQIFNEILRQCVEKGLVGGAIQYTDSTHIKAKANKHKKRLITVEETPKAYLEELNEQVDKDRKTLKKKPFDRDDDPPSGSGTTTRMQSTTDPESGQQCREGKPGGFHYSEHRTVDSKNNVIVNNVIVNVHIEPANINDITPIPEILKEIEGRLGYLPQYMGLDAGYHSAWIARLLTENGIQGVIGYRRHTHKTETYGKYRFKYNDEFDAYVCPEKHHLYWKTTTREGYRQYFCDSKICRNCPKRAECFGASTTRRMVTRHVWQDELDTITHFTKKTAIGRRIYEWRKETIERSFTEAKVNHGLRFARMCGIQNMREQSFLTAAVQNMKRLAKTLGFIVYMLKVRVSRNTRALSMIWVLRAGGPLLIPLCWGIAPQRIQSHHAIHARCKMGA